MAETETEVVEAVEAETVEQAPAETETKPVEGDEAPTREQVYIQDLRSINNRLKEAQSKEADFKQKHKAAKERVEAIQSEMEERIDQFDREANDPQLRLPFDQAKKEIDPEAARIAAMRKTLLSSAAFGFTAKVVESLTEKGVVTFGDFCDFEKRYANSADWLLDLPGIGQTKADTIRDKINDFQMSFRLPTEPEAVEEPETADEPESQPEDDTNDIAG